MATKRKTNPEISKSKGDEERKKQASEAVEEALARRERKGFWKTCWSIFLGTILCCSMFVGAIVFSIIALIVLPFALPINYIMKAIRGTSVQLPMSLSDGED